MVCLTFTRGEGIWIGAFTSVLQYSFMWKDCKSWKMYKFTDINMCLVWRMRKVAQNMKYPTAVWRPQTSLDIGQHYHVTWPHHTTLQRSKVWCLLGWPVKIESHSMFSYAMHPGPASFLLTFLCSLSNSSPCIQQSHKLLWLFLNVEKVVKVTSVLSRIFEHSSFVTW